MRSQILLMDPLPPVGKTYSLILQDETQKYIQCSTRAEHSVIMANGFVKGQK